jgi:hypothetical protein
MRRTVTLSQRAHDGRVTYTEGLRSIIGQQESGAGDALAILSMGSEQDWRAGRAWAVPRRSQILRFIAEEVIARHFPDAAAEIDEATGEIVIRDLAAAPGLRTTTAADTFWGRRYAEMKGRVGLLVLAAVVAFALAGWIGTRMAASGPGDGQHSGSSLS